MPDHYMQVRDFITELQGHDQTAEVCVRAMNSEEWNSMPILGLQKFCDHRRRVGIRFDCDTDRVTNLESQLDRADSLLRSFIQIMTECKNKNEMANALEVHIGNVEAYLQNA